jgi:hypothetical protein
MAVLCGIEHWRTNFYVVIPSSRSFGLLPVIALSKELALQLNTVATVCIQVAEVSYENVSLGWLPPPVLALLLTFCSPVLRLSIRTVARSALTSSSREMGLS